MTIATPWTVPADHPALAGHFPGNPVLPGAVLLDVVLEVISRTCGVALDRCEFSSVKFLNPALPGEELVIQHEYAAGGAIRFDVVAGARKIASGSIAPGTSA